MPKRPIENLDHGALTDHRILQDPLEDLGTRDQILREPTNELIYDERPLRFEDAKPDLRSLALAYPQVAGQYPELRKKGFEVMQQAAREFPDDAEVQATYGQVLSVVRPGVEAVDVLQKAINEVGSVPPTSNHIPPNTRTISIEQWRMFAYRATITESDKPDSQRKAFVRSVNGLLEANLIGKWGDYVWII